MRPHPVPRATGSGGSLSSGHLRPNRDPICDLCYSTFLFPLVLPPPVLCTRRSGARRRHRSSWSGHSTALPDAMIVIRELLDDEDPSPPVRLPSSLSQALTLRRPSPPPLPPRWGAPCDWRASKLLPPLPATRSGRAVRRPYPVAPSAGRAPCHLCANPLLLVVAAR
jgi:hypothetical protein